MVRLSGLYDTHKGPHTYWLQLASQGSAVASCGDTKVNMLHYEDAASATVNALRYDHSSAAVGR